MAKVSIVIPTYNSEKYIEESIDSVSLQTNVDFEIVVIDDGSTDGTEAIVKELSKKDKRVKYYYQNNKGPGGARNRGIKEAQGEYIAFLDADDLLLKDSLEKRLTLFSKLSSIGLVFTDYYLEDNSGTNSTNDISYLKKRNFLKELSSATEWTEHGYLLNKKFFEMSVIKGSFIWTSTVMVKKEVLNEVGGFSEDLRRSQDKDLWYRIIKKYNVGYIDKPLAVYKRYRGFHGSNPEKELNETIKFSKRLLSIAGNRKQKRAIKNRLARYYYELGDHYISISKRAVAIENYLKSLNFNFINKKSWLGFSKAILVPIKARKAIRKRWKK